MSTSSSAQGNVRRLYPGQPAYQAAESRDSLIESLVAPARGAVRRVRWIIGGILAAFMMLAMFIPISSGAVASGQLAPDQARQIIQHPTGGVVREILVRDGQHVRAGQVLLRLEAIEEGSNAGVLDSHIFSLRAEETVRRAEVDGAAAPVFPPDLQARADDPAVAPILAAQASAFAARHAQLETQTAQARAQRGQIHAQIRAAAAQERAATEQLSRIDMELQGYYRLLERGYIARTRVWAVEREQAELGGRIGTLRAEQDRLRAQDAEFAARLRQVELDARARAAEALRAVQDELSQARRRFTAAEDVLDRTQLRAPTSGVVMALRANTVGGVISRADPVMEIVPDRGRLIVRVRVRPQDGDDVRRGARAIVRFDAVSARIAPRVHGEVEFISADAIADPHTGETHFEASVAIAPEDVRRLPQGAYAPGLPAEVLIETGSRSLFSYLLGPIDHAAFRAMREE